MRTEVTHYVSYVLRNWSEIV